MHKKYKILLSAYACEPNKGSEQGVGWNWAIEVAKRGHYVWVLTRENNKHFIDSYFRENPKPENLNFVYYDLPFWLRFWKKGSRGVHLYYLLWQIAILKTGLNLHKSIKYDFVHHITFVTIHQPSFLFLLRKIPFFYGPTAGGDIIDGKLLKSFPLKLKIKEHLRHLQCKLLIFDPLRVFMFRRTNYVFYNSELTRSFLPTKSISNSFQNLAIGVQLPKNIIEPNNENVKKTRLLYVGNFLYLKGLHLLLKSYSEFKLSESVELTLIGKEVEIKTTDFFHINTISWINQEDLFKMYSNFDLMVFPSLRDSGGMVVLEAMSYGLPVICLDLGGPGQIVNETCGRIISTKNKTEYELIEDISNAIQELSSNKQLLESLSQGAIKRTSEFTWDKTVGRVYQEIEDYMSKLQKDGEA